MGSNMGATKNYVPALDSLRWLSALAVIITHVEMHKGRYGLYSMWSNPWIQNLGPVGVYFFFTLSGFLITWLLQKNFKKRTPGVLSSFFMRRLTRILPLYLLMVVVGFIVLPHVWLFQYPGKPNVSLNSAEFLAFGLCQPHIAAAFLERVPNVSHLWSIGVELTFYLFWPFVVLKSSNLNRSIVVVICMIIAVKVAAFVLAPYLFEDTKPIFDLAASLKFECMAIGAWFSLPLEGKLREFLARPYVVVTSMALVPCVFLLYGTPLDDGVHLLLSSLFGVLISRVVWGSSLRTGVLNNRVTQYLGRISYGIYCYHVACIIFMLNFLGDFAKGAYGGVFLYGGVLCLSVAVSSLSFHCFERPVARSLLSSEFRIRCRRLILRLQA